MKVLFEKTLYKNHGKQIGWWTIKAVAHVAEGTALLDISYAKTLNGAVVSKETPVKGVNVGKANETTPADQAVSEAQSRVKKQIDKGYVETKEAATAPATNASGNEMPMLAKPRDKVKLEDIDWSTAYAQPKLDGHRCLAKNAEPYSRKGQAINLDHIKAAIVEAGLSDVHLDGELYVHGILLNEIGSLIKDPREESKVVEYHIYDSVSDLPFIDRYNAVAMRLAGQPVFGVTQSSQHSVLKLVPTVKVDSIEAWDHLHAQWLAAGYEGSMLRWSTKGYADGKRVSELLKRKDFDDAEYPVIGYKEGTPTVSNGVTYRVPVWTFDAGNGKTFEATAAGTMQEKDEQFQAADLIVAARRYATVQHFGFTVNGLPNLPVVKRWREDV